MAPVYKGTSLLVSELNEDTLDSSLKRAIRNKKKGFGIEVQIERIAPDKAVVQFEDFESKFCMEC